MKRIFTAAALAVVALASLSGCGAAPVGVSAGLSSPTSLLAVRNDVHQALFSEKAILGADDLGPGTDRAELEQVVRQFRQYADTAIGHSRGSADLQGYAKRLEATQKRDAGLKRHVDVTALGNADLAYTAGDYEAAFKAVSDDIDAKLGVAKPAAKASAKAFARRSAEAAATQVSRG